MLRGEGISRELVLHFKARAFTFKLHSLRSWLALINVSLAKSLKSGPGDLASQLSLHLVEIFQLNIHSSN